MAHFYGVVSGARGPASRLGHKNTGISTSTEGWGGKITVHLGYSEERDEDMARVTLESKDGKLLATLYEGPLNRYLPENERLTTLLALRSLAEDTPAVSLGEHLDLLRMARRRAALLDHTEAGVIGAMLDDALGPFKALLPEKDRAA